MSRPVPVCHRTIGADQFTYAPEDTSPTVAYVLAERLCIGSRCALWLDALEDPGHGMCSEVRPGLHANPTGELMAAGCWPDLAQEGGDS